MILYTCNMTSTNLSLGDKLCLQFDTALRTIFGKPSGSGRHYPAQYIKETDLTDKERRHSEGYMRVNHVGEVCAQALYQGQALTARDKSVKDKMQQASLEENDHLIWCEKRLQELGGHKSYLNPLWYLGALSMGITAGIIGDKWNLGFLAETEKQVTAHLQGHIQNLPAEDKRSLAIVEQMAEDEQEHAEMAIASGAASLPQPAKKAMKMVSKIMTVVAYYI